MKGRVKRADSRSFQLSDPDQFPRQRFSTAVASRLGASATWVILGAIHFEETGPDVGATDDIAKAITTTLDATWNIRDGQVVPETDDVALGNGAVKLNATFLYADLASSTKLARQFDRRVAAKIVRSFLSSATRLIKDAGGEVRSFDGDRVMGVFVGKSKNTAATRCALKINYIVQHVLRPHAEAKFPSLKAKGFVIAHCSGIHTSEVLVVRGGVRGSNDLVFVGSAPNFAAKLSEVRSLPANSYVTKQVYDSMNDTAKLGGNPKRLMWAPVKCTLAGETWPCYRSTWWVKP